MISYITINDFEFRYNKVTDEYTLVQYFGNAYSPSLPDNINGYNYKIGKFAFDGANIVSIVIPQGVTDIYFYAFRNCYRLLEIYNLSSLNISAGSRDSYGEIKRYAITVHTSMDEPSVLIKQGDYYFYYNQSQNSYYLFAYVGNDTEVILPDTINGYTYRIDYRAFISNTNIVSVTISDGVTEIASRAFEGCTNLTDAFFELTTGWTRKGSSLNSDVVYESADLADSKNAATILKNLTYTGKPMIRSE